MNPIDIKQYGDVCEALRAWFQSQDIEPGESMKIIAYFVACMSYYNASGDREASERKLALMNTTAHEFAAMFHALKVIP